MDHRFDVDREALARAVAEVDHVVFRLTTVPQRLLVDFRSGGDSGPAVVVLPPAESLGERLTSIREARPDLPAPEKLNVIPWPLRVGGLARLGAIEAIRDRLVDMDAFEALGQLDAAYERLVLLERDEMLRAITGEGYRTLWSATSPN